VEISCLKLYNPIMAPELLHHRQVEGTAMDAFVIGATLLGSFMGAFVIQRIALEGLFRIMDPERKSRD
jgi:hypothetical protein